MKIHLSLLIMLIGVTIVSVTDVELNMLGTIIAFTGVVITSLYQIWVNTMQSSLQANSMQLLYYQSRLSCIFLMFLFPIFDDVNLLFSFLQDLTFRQLAWIVISALLALFVNISTFYVIGDTSPITYNVVGHLKTCIVLVGGFALFQYPIEWRNMVGIMTTLSGIIIYTYFKLKKD